MWIGEEMKMSDVFELPLEPVEYQNGIIDSNGFAVLFADLNDAEKLALCSATNNHDRLVEENRRLTELAAQKASRADELYNRLDKSQMLINSVGLIFMNDTLSAKEKEKQLKSLFDIHGDEIYLDNRELLDKIKQESANE